MSCASSGHITKQKQSIFAPFDIYDIALSEKHTFSIGKVEIPLKMLINSKQCDQIGQNVTI